MRACFPQISRTTEPIKKNKTTFDSPEKIDWKITCIYLDVTGDVTSQVKRKMTACSVDIAGRNNDIKHKAGKSAYAVPETLSNTLLSLW